MFAVDASKSSKSRKSQPRHSGIPVKKTTTLSNTASSKLPSGRATADVKASPPPPSGFQRQTSGDSLEENYQEFDRNLNDLMQRNERKGRGGGAKNGSAHIEEWLRQTTKDAIPPDMLGEAMDAPARDINSPTFTDNSLNYSQAVSQNLYSELPLIWTPKMRPPLYSGHLEMSQSMLPSLDSPLK